MITLLWLDEIKLTQVKSTERILLYVGIVVITAHFLITQFSLNYWISSLEPCKAQVWDEIQQMSLSRYSVQQNFLCTRILWIVKSTDEKVILMNSAKCIPKMNTNVL